MNNIKKDWKFYLVSFIFVVFLAGLPKLILHFISLPFQVDFMDIIFYYLGFFIFFLASLILLFFGFGKRKLKSRKTFLVYYSVLFLSTLYAVAYWLGLMLDSLFSSPFRLF